jgi:virginiamycin B lyase
VTAQRIANDPLRCQPTFEFSLPAPGAFPGRIVAGPDGNLWFTAFPGLGSMTTSGAAVLTALTGSQARDLAFDKAGNLWFTEDLKIGRRAIEGSIVEFTVPNGGRPERLAVASDGDVWFTETTDQRLVRMTPTGSFFEIQVSIYPYAITSGPDSNLWVTESGDRIARVTPSGAITEFDVPGASNQNSSAIDITTGPDGNLWFAEPYGVVGRITTEGVISLFPLPRFQVGEALGGVALGPDGNLWVTASSAAPLEMFPVSSVARVTPKGEISEFSLPTASGGAAGISAGPDGNLWLAENLGNQIAKVAPIQPCSLFAKEVTFRESPPAPSPLQHETLPDPLPDRFP